MKNLFSVVVALLLTAFIFGCQSSGETKVTGGGVPGPNSVVTMSPEEEALVADALENNRKAGVMATQELSGKKTLAEQWAAQAPANTGDPVVDRFRLDVKQVLEDAERAAKPAPEPAADKPQEEPKPAEEAKPPAEKDPGEKKESASTDGQGAVAMTDDPALDRLRMEVEKARAGEEIAVPKRRCMACDDVSDTVQCLDCWGYHLKGAAHSSEPEGEAMCPT